MFGDYSSRVFTSGKFLHLKRSATRLWRIRATTGLGGTLVSNTKARATGNCVLEAVDRATGLLVPGEGKSNLTFTVEIENKSDSDGTDTYLLQVKESGAPLNGFYMSKAVNLQGGDVKVVR